MAELKNSSVDLLVRQMPAARKKEEKPVDGCSGFKTLLKDRNQKKEDGNEEAKESGNLSEGAAAEAAALVAAGAVETQNPADMLRLMGQGLAQKLGEGPATGNVQGVAEEKGEKELVLDPFQTVNQLRFQNLTEISGQEAVSAEAVTIAVLPEAKEKMPGADLPDKIGMPGTTDLKESSGHKEAADQEILGKTDMPVSDQEGGKKVSDMQRKGLPEAVPVRKEEEAIPPVQREKVNTVSAEKDDKKLEADPGILRENSYEPNRLLHIQPKTEEAAYTTVKAENLDGLEAKLSQQIIKQIHEGRGELDVQLEPHNLGKIRIKVSYEDSQVSVSVLCSESRTLKLLSQSAGELGSILENNLERPVQILVDKQGAGGRTGTEPASARKQEGRKP